MNIQRTPISLNLNNIFGAPAVSTYVEQFIGLTEWLRTSDDPPPFTGWWRTYSSSVTLPQRRYWDGSSWSAPVYSWMPDYAIIIQRTIPCSTPSGDILWCGLRKPHLAGYFDLLLPSQRLSQIQAKKRKEPK